MRDDAAQHLGVQLAGLLSLAAGFLHGSLIQEHLQEWWGYGLFFVAASIAQGVYGLVLLALPRRPTAWAHDHWEAWRRRLFLLGIAGNVAVLGLYVVTRTVGVPLGPGAGGVEPIGVLDLPTKAVEVATVALLAWLCFAKRAGTATPQAA